MRSRRRPNPRRVDLAPKVVVCQARISTAGPACDRLLELSERRLRIPEAIKAVGTYAVAVRLHIDVESSFTVVVRAEGAPPEEKAEVAAAASPDEGAAEGAEEQVEPPTEEAPAE